MTDFRDHLSFDAFMQIARHHHAFSVDLKGEDVARWREESHRLEKTLLRPALRSFLLALRDTGKLSPIRNGGHYQVSFVDQWNTMVAGGEELSDDTVLNNRLWAQLTERFDGAFSGLFSPLSRWQGDPEALPAVYEATADRFNQGNLTHHDLGQEFYSFETGQSMRIQFQGWVGELGMLDAKNRYAFVPAPSIEREDVREIEVDFPSGHLLIADWFRISAFTNAVKDHDRDFDINSSRGAADLTEWTARTHGFLTVCVGNSSPGIFTTGSGSLVVGWEDEDSESTLPSLGRVCTDLWWTTIIDKATLIEIVARADEDVDARKVVEDYLAENDVIEYLVPPGRHYLYAMGDHERFKDAFRSDDIDCGGVEPFFVLSDSPLTLKNDSPARPRPR